MKVLKFYEAPSDTNIVPDGQNPPDTGGEDLGLGGIEDLDRFIADAPRIDPQPLDPEPQDSDPNQQQNQDPQNQQPPQGDWAYEYEGAQYTPDQLGEAIKSHQNKEKWQKNLTQESQAIKWLMSLEPEERLAFRNEALLHAYGKKEFKPGDDIKLPKHFEVEHTDSEGYKTTVKVPMDHEMIQKAIAFGEAKAKAEFGPAFETVNQKSEQLSQYEAQHKEFMAETQFKEIFSHPSVNIKLEKGQKATALINMVRETGKTHPMYKQVERMLNASKVAQVDGTTILEALDSLYGDVNIGPNSSVVRKQNLKNNQQKGVPLTPGGSDATPPSDDILEDIKNSASYKTLEALESFM